MLVGVDKLPKLRYTMTTATSTAQAQPGFLASLLFALPISIVLWGLIFLLFKTI